MKRYLLVLALAAFGASAEDMKPNKDPVPSPSDMRAARFDQEAGGLNK